MKNNQIQFEFTGVIFREGRWFVSFVSNLMWHRREEVCAKRGTCSLRR